MARGSGMKAKHQAVSFQPLWSVHQGNKPLLATALHSGHELRAEVKQLLAIDEYTQLREEDPYTDYLATVSPTYIIPYRSRFEVDLNRKRKEAVYSGPEDAWGLEIWKEHLPLSMIQASLAEYDAFYVELEKQLSYLQAHYGHFVIFDLHSYNHRREGPDSVPENPRLNPEVNVGTGSMNRDLWGSLVDRFIRDLRKFDFIGRHLDVRENVLFVGRQLASWVHVNFPQSGCVLAVEFKKFFMDEWTGAASTEEVKAIYEALKSTIPGIVDELQKMKAPRRVKVS